METARLILREWRASDTAPFAAMSADQEVMEFLGGPLTPEEVTTFVARMREKFQSQGFGFWALEEKATGAFIGFTGLNRPNFSAPFMPCVEIGWRLARHAWGKGLATEAARAALNFGFGPAKLTEIVAFTARTNTRSRAVMTRLGMTYDPADDFEHPALAEGHALRPHVLYTIKRPSGKTD